MFRSVDSEERFSKGTTPINRLDAARENLASPWIGMFSAWSRPLWSILNRYLPGRAHAMSSEDGKSIDFGLSLVPGFDNIMPAGQSSAHLSIDCICCQDKKTRFNSLGDTGSLTLLTQDSLSKLGIQNMDPKTQTQARMRTSYLTAVKQLLSQGFLNVASTQKEATQSKLDDWSQDPSIKTTYFGWWDGFGGSGETLPCLYQIRMSTDVKTKSLHCREHHSDQGSTGAAPEPIELLVLSNKVEWMLPESAGPLCFKGSDNESLHAARLESLARLSSAHEHVVELQVGTRTAAACSEVAVLTPDQDNGYSSLEDELSNMRQSNMNICEQLLENDSTACASDAGCHGNGSNGGKPDESSKPDMDENKVEEQEQTGQSSVELSSVNEASPVQPTYQCQNKAIAYILGGPCSDESDSEDESDQDDDGFDSEDSSDVSDDSEDEGDTDVDEDDESDELDPESERLWNSLCQTKDPYDPRNFTAAVTTSPRSRDAEAEPSPSGSSAEPATGPESFLSSSPSSCPSPLGPQGSEELSEEACSSTDEAESLRLWNSFSCSSDPYSPLNFQAPIRTCKTARVCAKKPTSGGNLRYRKEEAEERMDSGFSECYRVKKVTFVEEVEEFYASSDEERHGPWEEYARDRCRFRRRVQEVEESIGYCLAPTFRLLTFQRLHPSS
ncbi:protein phosphatase 1 regulatory subunit 15B [Trichomycterus rosablanca]|uniref:protein phosphatase 1 regulatory subunit 15B n=1 Tax=Trichomycterus rosablanca TaxID=2290929 RepID=UPI002F34FA78